MSLIEEVLSEERKVLKQLGCGLNEVNADRNYPDSYFKDYTYNLFQEMADKHKEQYGGGSGGEINASDKKPAKMASIRSSSAMAFNLLGNDSVFLLENNSLCYTPGKYGIEYEKQHETIIGKGQQPANLDAFLESEDGSEVIFCEMKMLEWFSKYSGKLKARYKDDHNYRYIDLAPQFIKTIGIIEKMVETSVFEYYDVWQMFKHTLAIHNYMHEKGWNNFKRVTLLNVVFEPCTSFMSDESREQYCYQAQKEHEGFESFRSALIQTGIINKDKCFDVKYISTKDFIGNIEMSADKIKYLNRYVLENSI